MKRTNIYLTNKQHQTLVLLAIENDTKISELVRRAIDEYFNQYVTSPSELNAISRKPQGEVT